VSPCRPLTLERRPLPKHKLLLRVSRPRPPRLRLPRHPGAIVFSESTPVSTPAAAFAPSRRCDCGGYQPVGSYIRLLLQSHRVRCPHCDCGGMLDCVCVWVGRHHCWVVGPLGLCVYICNNHLYAISVKQFTFPHNH
jgi:hypothetical protein